MYTFLSLSCSRNTTRYTRVMQLNFHLNDFPEKLALWKLHVRKTVKIRGSYPKNRRSSNLLPKGRLNWRKGGECFAPCICFAQLRAEMSEKGLGEARRSSEILKILIFKFFSESSFLSSLHASVYVFLCLAWSRRHTKCFRTMCLNFHLNDFLKS